MRGDSINTTSRATVNAAGSRTCLL